MGWRYLFRRTRCLRRLDADHLNVEWATHAENREYELKMKRRTGLSGHVFDPAGQPVEGAVVKARGQGAGSDSHVTATTDADGTFSMKVQSEMAYRGSCSPRRSGGILRSDRAE